MDKKLIQQLKDAGVGADIILNLILQPDEEPKTQPEEVPEKMPEPAPAPKQEAAAPAVPDPIMDKIDKLIGVIQASNIIRSGRESAPEESVDDILAAMVQPRKKED